MRPRTYLAIASLVAACSRSSDSTTGPGPALNNAPCGTGDTLRLSVGQAARIDCSNGTRFTLAGNGASYLVVPEFGTDQGSNSPVSFRLTTAGASANVASHNLAGLPDVERGVLPPLRANVAQLRADRILLDRAQENWKSVAYRSALMRQRAVNPNIAFATVPSVGSLRTFRVLSNFTSNTFKSVSAQLVFVGTNILIYVDTLAPAGGFTTQQLTDFGNYFDQVLYSLTVNAFGGPSDIDQNGHVIMLMSPVVNADTPAATCNSQGFIAGFFHTIDFLSSANVNSNQGELFYSIVPDPAGQFSCAHSVAALGLSLGATFMHELEHLVNFSQHVVIGGGNPGASWLDEGLAIVAEELGSIYFEQKCPPPSCRTNPSQIFPDSAQGFVAGFLFDSYQWALRPDTASITLHTDDQQGLSWRGGTWLISRWLGDQFGSGVFLKLVRGPSNGFTDIEQAIGQSIGPMYANFTLALYTDSLPGLPRNTAPPINRFLTRNVKQLWARLFATSGPSSSVPRPDPLQLTPITTSTTTFTMVPGTATYFRLDTSPGTANVVLQFTTPGGGAFATSLKPQVAVFRLPPGQ